MSDASTTDRLSLMTNYFSVPSVSGAGLTEVDAGRVVGARLITPREDSVLRWAP